MNIDNIPDELLQLPNWVCWRKAMKNGKVTKIPHNPYHPECKASSTNPDTWADFIDAKDAYEQHNMDGIGFVFTKDAGIVGIDLDHCLENNSLNDYARNVVNSLNSYTEISPSQNGVHVFVLGQLSGKGVNKAQIEIYDTGRFFTVTGNALGKPKPIRDGNGALSALYNSVSKPNVLEPVIDNVTPMFRDEMNLPLIDRFCDIGIDAEQVWEQPQRFKSQSEADLELATICCANGFSTEDIAELIALYRIHHKEQPAKAKRKDYLVSTIIKAQTNALRRKSLPQTNKGKLQIIGARDLIDSYKPTKWLIKGWFMDSGLIWIAGQWGCYKTFLTLDIAFHVAHGFDWCGCKVNQGKVLYINGEGQSGILKRLAALEEHYKQQCDNAQFKIIPQPVLLNEPETLNELLEIVKQHGANDVDLLVIDTKSANMTGSDSDPGIVNNWLNVLRYIEHELQCVIIVVDHVGHVEKGRPRGVSQQMGAADAVYMVEEKEKDTFYELRTEKSPKDSKAPDELEFKVNVVELPNAFNDEDGDKATSVCLSLNAINKPGTKREPLTTTEQKILNWTRETCTAHTRAMLEQDENYKWNWDYKCWKNEVKNAGIVSKSSAYRSCDRLISKDYIRVVGTFIELAP